LQRIEGDGAVRNMELANQLLCGGDLVGFLVDVDMRQEPGQIWYRRRAAVGLPCGLRNCRNFAWAPFHQAQRRVAIKTLVDVANGGMGRRALPAQTECRVQPAAVHRDESFERAIGIAPADHGEDREQQDVGQLIQYSFPSARRGSGISPSKPINSSNDRKAIAWLIGCRA
jgi:hypothetical protein